MRYRGVDDKSNNVKGKQVIAKAMVIARIVVARNHRGSLVFEREKMLVWDELQKICAEFI